MLDENLFVWPWTHICIPRRRTEGGTACRIDFHSVWWVFIHFFWPCLLPDSWKAVAHFERAMNLTFSENQKYWRVARSRSEWGLMIHFYKLEKVLPSVLNFEQDNVWKFTAQSLVLVDAKIHEMCFCSGWEKKKVVHFFRKTSSFIPFKQILFPVYHGILVIKKGSV